MSSNLQKKFTKKSKFPKNTTKLLGVTGVGIFNTPSRMNNTPSRLLGVL